MENVMLYPESVILNLIQNLFRAGLIQHLTKSRTYETLKSKTLNLVLNQVQDQIQDLVQGDRLGLLTRPLNLSFEIGKKK
jgi:predicted transcriptional regulator